MRLLIATSNPHKVQEIRQIIGPADLEIVGLDAYPDAHMPEESGHTFLENARIKATSVARQTGQLTMADDSGLCVDALGGSPGIHSNRFLGEGATQEDRNNTILKLLGPKKEDERTAKFVCAACVAFPNGKTLDALETCQGIIARRPVGVGGFGYDPIFYIPHLGQTLAEAPQEVKNGLSHRGKAVRSVVSQLLLEISIP